MYIVMNLFNDVVTILNDEAKAKRIARLNNGHVVYLARS